MVTQRRTCTDLSPAGTYTESLVPYAAEFRGGALGKWLDHWGPDSIDGFILYRVVELWHYSEVESRVWVLIGRHSWKDSPSLCTVPSSLFPRHHGLSLRLHYRSTGFSAPPTYLLCCSAIQRSLDIGSVTDRQTYMQHSANHPKKAENHPRCTHTSLAIKVPGPLGCILKSLR